MKIITVILGFIFLFTPSTYGQEISLKGQVTDSIGPVANVLITANLLGENVEKNALSDLLGAYELKLERNKMYSILLTHLGHKTYYERISTMMENLTIDYFLIDSLTVLNEVILEHKVDIIRKKDTTIYNIENFTSGEERKLRQIVRKLPGLSLEKDQLSFNGVMIDKILLEGKPFFTGNTNMALSNIPGKVIDQIKIIENYVDESVLIGLEDSEMTVLNVTLKKDKKEFYFGDLDVEGGYKTRYKFHPTIYHYSPKANFSFLGDFNNVGFNSFTFNDYLSFEGGLQNFSTSSIGNRTSLDGDLASLLGNSESNNESNIFGAISFVSTVNNNWDLSTYLIYSKKRAQSFESNRYEYLNLGENLLTENRQVIGDNQNNFLLGKLDIRKTVRRKKDFHISNIFKFSNSFNEIDRLSDFDFDSNNILSSKNATLNSWRTSFVYNQSFSKSHKMSIRSEILNRQNSQETRWMSDRLIPGEFLEESESGRYIVNQTKHFNLSKVQFNLNNYFVVNRFNTIRLLLGSNVSWIGLDWEEAQVLDDFRINPLLDKGFGDNLKNNIGKTNITISNKLKTGNLYITAGLTYNYFFRINKSIYLNNHNDETVISPSIKLKYEISRSENITFLHNYDLAPPMIGELSNRLIIRSYNDIFKGNSNLNNELYKNYNLSYRKSNLIDKLFINSMIKYVRTISSNKENTELNNITRLSTIGTFENLEQLIIFRNGIRKKIGKIEWLLNYNFNYSDFFSFTNEKIVKNQRNRNNLTLGLNRAFNKNSYLSFNYSIGTSQYRNSSGKFTFFNNSYKIEYQGEISKRISLDAKILISRYKNDLNNVFKNNTGDLNLLYHKPDSPFTLGLKVYNLFNQKFIQNNSQDNFLLLDRKFFITPRIISLNLAYNF